MTVNFSTGFKPTEKYIPTVKVGSPVPATLNTINTASPANTALTNDKVEINQEPKKRQSLFSKISTFIGNIKKGFATVGEYTKGVFKGTGAAAVTGSLLYTGITICNKLSKSNKQLSAKALGIVGAVIAFGINMYNAYLNTNDAKATIDHRYH